MTVGSTGFSLWFLNLLGRMQNPQAEARATEALPI